MDTNHIMVAGLLLILPTQLSMAKETVGWVEKARIYPGGVVLKAKIDTGAKTSSLHCDDATTVKRNGEQWVTITIRDDRGGKIQLKRKVERIAKIKRHFGEKQERYVVKLGICLGNTYKETDVSLIDRSDMNYQLLIGRRFLKGSHVIDPAVTFAAKPACMVVE